MLTKFNFRHKLLHILLCLILFGANLDIDKYTIHSIKNFGLQSTKILMNCSQILVNLKQISRISQNVPRHMTYANKNKYAKYPVINGLYSISFKLYCKDV